MAPLISPEILESSGRQGGVYRRARDRAMPQILLNCPRVVTFGGEGVAAGVAPALTAARTISRQPRDRGILYILGCTVVLDFVDPIGT